MQVENWVQNFTSDGFQGFRRQNATMSKRAYARLCRDAKGYLDGYGLDFSQLDGPMLVFDDMHTCNATWTHRETKQEVELTSIWFDHKTGEVLQAGTSYGKLSL